MSMESMRREKYMKGFKQFLSEYNSHFSPAAIQRKVDLTIRPEKDEDNYAIVEMLLPMGKEAVSNQFTIPACEDNSAKREMFLRCYLQWKVIPYIQKLAEEYFRDARNSCNIPEEIKVQESVRMVNGVPNVVVYAKLNTFFPDFDWTIQRMFMGFSDIKTNGQVWSTFFEEQ